MGYRATVSAEEDLLCAEIIAAGLTGVDLQVKEKIAELRYSSGKRFFVPENSDFSPPEDFFLCTDADRFSFVLKAGKAIDGCIILEKTEVSQ
jgi:hypothetical protein